MTTQQVKVKAKALRRDHVLAPLLLLPLALSLGAAAPVHGHLLDAWAVDSGVVPEPVLPSARLQSLGGMREAVPDENNEINLLDFAGNLVGHLDDKPDAHIDVYSGPRRWLNRTTAAAFDHEVKNFPTGIRVNTFPGQNQAVGGTIDVNLGSSRRLVEQSFREAFRLPIENQLTGSNEGTQIRADLDSEFLTAHYVRRLGQRFAAGVQGGWGKEQESRGSGVLYQIDHDARTWALRVSLVGRLPGPWGPVRNWVAGGNWRSASTKIDGVSEDDRHLDRYAWDRPSVGFDVHLLGDVGDRVKGGLDFRYDSFEGQERIDYNWSEQFPLNGTNRNIRLARSSFREGLRAREFRTRWEVRPPEGNRFWGFGFEARREDYWLLPEVNVNSFMEARGQRLTEWRGTAGMTHFLSHGKGLLAGELAYGWADLDNSLSFPTTTVRASLFEIGVGAEYAVALPLVARAGYRLILDDGDRDRNAAEDEFVTHRAAIGAGWRTADGRILLDLGFNYDFVDPEAKDIYLDRDRQILTLQLRSLF